MAVPVSDDVSCPPRHPPALRRPKHSEPIWQLQLDYGAWSAELRFHGESCSWDARVLRDGELVIGRQFALRRLAVQWADEQRKVLENSA